MTCEKVHQVSPEPCVQSADGAVTDGLPSRGVLGEKVVQSERRAGISWASRLPLRAWRELFDRIFPVR